ncbi:MFS transporter [Pseudomonas sp. MWU13-2105]|uniref:MFS transporter n=1 Tax=Pseudomonas sp. MWU13-2105 TaxID=2935074 RepID=UPI00200FEA27|nr:MFS transporter [Pseudomonas sp. MWU13-2105]
MNTPDTVGGRAVLTLAHVAGMVDMVALPLWIGALMQYYQFSAPQAGGTVSLFLLAVVLVSGALAPHFSRLPHRLLAAAGFAVAACAFFLAYDQQGTSEHWGVLIALHGLAGVGIGCALSVTHGAIGRNGNPHRLFAMVSMALGLSAVLFLSLMPMFIARLGAPVLFLAFALLMTLAAVVAALFFPSIEVRLASTQSATGKVRLPRPTWPIIGVVICLTMNQSMVFGFLERLGHSRGFSSGEVNGVLICLGLVNLLPGLLAALLQKRWSAIWVGIVGPVIQAILALVMVQTPQFGPYALAASLYVAVVIFTHTFLFGLLTRLDPSGAAASATPAMTMIGSCIGPLLGGLVVASIGYQGLGWAACLIALVAVLLMRLVQRREQACVSPRRTVAHEAA